MCGSFWFEEYYRLASFAISDPGRTTVLRLATPAPSGIFIARFIPSIKEIAPFVAGTVGMRRQTFFIWNVLGGIGWGLQWVGGGYLWASFWWRRTPIACCPV